MYTSKLYINKKTQSDEDAKEEIWRKGKQENARWEEMQEAFKAEY